MGISLLSLHRISHRLQQRGHARLARLVQALIYALFTAVVPPEVEFGERVEFMHNGFGVLMHPNTVVGNDVYIYHHVTLATDIAGSDPRRLVIEDHALIGAGAIVLGPITVGRGATIGAGAVVTKDVAPGDVVVGNPARVLTSSPRG